jgi:hypothetical protein
MNRTIRTATATSGKPRRRRRTVRALTTGILTAGSVAALAAPAQAYDGATCAQALGGANNVFDVDPVRIDTKRVDFGDLPHSFVGGGAPQADAVVCWGRDRVVVVGRLFYDAPLAGQDALVDLVGFNGPNQHARTWTVAGTPGAVTNREVLQVWPPELGRIDRLRIELKLTPQGVTGNTGTSVHRSEHFRGD